MGLRITSSREGRLIGFIWIILFTRDTILGSICLLLARLSQDLFLLTFTFSKIYGGIKDLSSSESPQKLESWLSIK